MVGFFGVGCTGASGLSKLGSSSMVGVGSRGLGSCECNDVAEMEGDGVMVEMPFGLDDALIMCSAELKRMRMWSVSRLALTRSSGQSPWE